MSDYMTRNEVSAVFNISTESVRALAAKGRRYPNRVGFLHEVKMGNRCLITRQSVKKRQELLTLLADKITQSPNGLTKPECAQSLGLRLVEVTHLLRVLSDTGKISKNGKRDVPDYGIEQIWVAST